MKPIVFTHLQQSIWQYKVASVLRMKGHKTVLVSLKKPDKEFSPSFDKIISLGLKDLKPKAVLTKLIFHPLQSFSFFKNLLTIKPAFAICEGPPHYLPALFIRFFKKKCKRIYFPYDMISSRYKDPVKQQPKREVWGELYSFTNSDGIICKADMAEFDLLPKHLNVNKPKLIFQPYTLREFFADEKEKLSKKDKKVHIVYVGGFGHNRPLYRNMSEYFYEILNQGFHLHLYCHLDEITPDHIGHLTKNKKKLLKNLHIHKSVSPRDLQSEISQYDYGLDAFYFQKKYVKDGVFSATNKLCSYLEAGLPVIMNKEKRLFSDLIKDKNIGIVVEDYNFKDLKNKIKKANYKKLAKSVLVFREEYSTENNINRLLSFFSKL